jgi:hypothetical protein
LLSKVSGLWGGTPVIVRLEDLDLMCQALERTVADPLEAEPVVAAGDADTRLVAGNEQGAGPVRPCWRRGVVSGCVIRPLMRWPVLAMGQRRRLTLWSRVIRWMCER